MIVTAPWALVCLLGSGFAQDGSLAELVKKLTSEDRRVRGQAVAGLKMHRYRAEALPRLRLLLKDARADVRGGAAMVIGTCGEGAKEVVPDLITALRAEVGGKPDEMALNGIRQSLETLGTTAVPALAAELKGNGTHRKVVLEILAKIGKVEGALSELRASFKDPDPEIRWRALCVLWHIGPAARDALSDALAALNDKSETVRSQAIQVLGCLGPDSAGQSVPALVKALREKSAEFRLHAAYALGQLGATAKAAVPDLIKMLGDRDPTIRFTVVEAIGRIGPDAASAVPMLIPLVKDADSTVRWQTVEALGNIGPVAKQAVPSLIEAFRTKELAVYAGESLGKIGPDAKDALPALIDALRGSDGVRALASVNGLGGIGKTAVPELIKTLKESKSGEAQYYAADALALIGTDANDAIPALVDALSIDHIVVQERAGKALKKLGTLALSVLLRRYKESPERRRHVGPVIAGFGAGAKESLSVLLDELTSADGAFKAVLADCIGSLGIDAVSAASALVRLLRDESLEAPVAAARALKRIGPGAALSVPTLVEMLAHRNSNLAWESAHALAAIGPDATPALLKALSHESGQARGYAAVALGEMKSPSKESVAMLALALKDTDKSVRGRAVEALCKLGPAGAEAVDALIAALKDQERVVRANAAVALGDIGPPARRAIPALKAALSDPETTVVNLVKRALDDLIPVEEQR